VTSVYADSSRGAALVRARSPLRIDFVGMTDYRPACRQFGGCIVNATINKYIYATARRRHDSRIVLRAPDHDLVVELPSKEALDPAGQLGLAQAVLQRFPLDCGLELTTYSEMPSGAGLGSSSTIATCVIGLLNAMLGHRLSDYEVAEQAIACERIALNTEYGWQDQYSPVTGGGIKFMRHYPDAEGGTIEVNQLPAAPAELAELEKRLVVCYTGISRPAKSILDKVAAGVREGEAEVTGALRAMSDCAQGLRRAFLAHELEGLGEILDQVWRLHKSLHPDVTNDRLEELHAVAMGRGALGGRVCGAGGGGTMLFYCQQNAEYAVKRALTEAGARVFDFSFSLAGLTIW